MNPAVEEYLRLTDEIKRLSDQRAALKPCLHEGRNFGLVRDIRVNIGNVNRLDMMLLRRYVTREVINMCMVTTHRQSFIVVPKAKPPKPKKGSK